MGRLPFKQVVAGSIPVQASMKYKKWNVEFKNNVQSEDSGVKIVRAHSAYLAEVAFARRYYEPGRYVTRVARNGD